MADTSDDQKAVEPSSVEPASAKPSSKKDASPPSELDPELIRLPRAKTRVRPIMALAIIAICLTIGLRLFPDLQFSRSSPTPIQVASIDELSSDLVNQYIEIRLRPDRPQALRILPNGSSVGDVVMPVLGSGGKLWLLVPPSPWSGPHATSELYRGRLSALSDMGFSETLRNYVKAGNNVPRTIPLAEIRKALASKESKLKDISGDTLEVAPDTFVRVQEVAVRRARVYAVSTDPYDNEAAWRLALEGAGILPPETAAISSDTGSWTFEVPAPDGLLAVQQKLEDAKLFAASATQIATTREGTWAELSLDGDDILLGKAQLGFRAEHVAVGASMLLPSDAFVLNTSEEPGTYWYVMALVLALAGFILLFAFGLYRSRS